jgi:cytidyltransferase-like protein
MQMFKNKKVSATYLRKPYKNEILLIEAPNKEIHSIDLDNYETCCFIELNQNVKIKYAKKPIKNKIVVASGYFNPLHKGHIRYLEAAKKLGDRLIVIVNNDKQVKLKRSKKFMDEKERLEIVSALGCVDIAVLSIDTTRDVSNTLLQLYALYNANVFANGGDRNQKNIPESKICKKHGIEIIDNVGGEKIQSSTGLKK